MPAEKLSDQLENLRAQVYFSSNYATDIDLTPTPCISLSAIAVLYWFVLFPDRKYANLRDEPLMPEEETIQMAGSSGPRDLGDLLEDVRQRRDCPEHYDSA